jgi:decaprenylphospho-beta-D-ribofuranose 2-oxidase
MTPLTAPPGELLTGWGRTAPSRSAVLGPLRLEQLQELVASGPERGVLARGAGRSYGDAAQNAGGRVLAPVCPPVTEIDATAGTVRASASVTFAELLAELVPRGLLLPVLPGTRHLTVGGAVAADVHGKNQHGDGSIGSWIDEIELLDGRGEVHRLTPGRDGRGGEDSAAFWATVGGMGMTGVILAVTLRLMRIRSTLLRVSARRLPDLDAVMAALDAGWARYSVAWVDTTAGGSALGRGIVEFADHLDAPHPVAEPASGLAYRPRRPRQAPALPFCPLAGWSARAFNAAWYRRARLFSEDLTGLPEFFHRLDAVSDWNRALGPRGILQYQFAVPAGGEHVIAAALERTADYAPFLGTLKRFGPASGAPLSFPGPGWSLAIDMPAGNPRLGPLLDELDQQVAAAGGRIYLAKDARMTRQAFGQMYGDLAGWRAARAKLDPAGVFQSDQGRRVGLC